MHFSRNKNITYQVNPSTGQNGKIPTINIPKPKNENSIFIQNLIEKSERFKTFGSNYKVLTKCCPKLSTNIQNIFSSDKRREDAMNYVKKLRENNSQIIEFTESQAQNRQSSVSKFFEESPIRFGMGYEKKIPQTIAPHHNRIYSFNLPGEQKTPPPKMDMERSLNEDGRSCMKKDFIEENFIDDDNENEIKQIYKRGEITNKVIHFDDNNKYFFLNKSGSNSNYSSKKNIGFYYSVEHFEFGFKHKETKKEYNIRLRKESNYFSVKSTKKKEKKKEYSNSSTNTDSIEEEEIIKKKVVNSPMRIEKKIQYDKENIDDNINKIKIIQQKFKNNKKNEIKNNGQFNNDFTGLVIFEINKGRKIKEYECDCKNNNVEELNEIFINNNVNINSKFLQFIDLNTKNEKDETIEQMIMTEEIPKENKETLTDPIQPKQKNDNETQTEKHHEISQEIDLKFKNKIKKTKEIEIQTDIEKELPKEREEKVINKIINEISEKEVNVQFDNIKKITQEIDVQTEIQEKKENEIKEKEVNIQINHIEKPTNEIDIQTDKEEKTLEEGKVTHEIESPTDEIKEEPKPSIIQYEKEVQTEEKEKGNEIEIQTDNPEIISRECETDKIEKQDIGLDVIVINKTIENGTNVNITNETEEKGMNTENKEKIKHSISNRMNVEIITESKRENKVIPSKDKESILEEEKETIIPLTTKADNFNNYIESIQRSYFNIPPSPIKPKNKTNLPIITDPTYEKITVNLPLKNKCYKKTPIKEVDKKENEDEENREIKNKLTFAPLHHQKKNEQSETINKEKIKKLQSAPVSVPIPEIISIVDNKPTTHKKKKKPQFTKFDEEYSKEKEFAEKDKELIEAIKKKALMFRTKFKKAKKEEGTNK